MKAKLLLYLSITASIIATSCSEKIDLKLDDTYTRLVVEANITTEHKYQEVKLTLTSSYFSNAASPVVSGADVTITNGDTTMVLLENPSGSGIYQTLTQVKLPFEKNYTLKINNVTIDGVTKEYEASCFMRQTMNLDSITYEKFEPTPMQAGQFGVDPNATYYKINGWGQENPTPGDYYLWEYYINDTLKTDTISESIFTDDLLVNGNYIPGLTMFLVKANPGDTIKVATYSISKEFYDFITSLMLETYWNAGPMSGPPANIKGNISNGALGFFRATDVTFVSVAIKE
mgnify:CR=1 FL=1